ncbi:MAG: hypothetical protein M5U22_13875 [Thermoleophilia bacterium]|nr:hypothetical protein [Thermoleophilia bacterium]
MGEAPPPELFAPILARAPTGEAAEPSGRLTPVLDGLLSHPEEWAFGGMRRVPRGGAMYRADGPVLDEIRYGCDEHNLYLLLRPSRAGFPPGTDVAVYMNATGPEGSPLPSLGSTRFHGRSRLDAQLGFDLTHEVNVHIEGPRQARGTLSVVVEEAWGSGAPLPETVFDQVVELALPLARLGLERPGVVRFVVAVARDGLLTELLPVRGAVVFDLATVANRRRAPDR